VRSKEKEILVECLARIEGEAGIRVKVRNGKVVSSQLRVFEPPRLFEAFLRGRSFREVPDITARICGICPVAYQMTAVQAIEQAFGVRVNDAIRALRHLMYYGEWIESHSLHVFLLHAPDFLGYADAMAMAKDHLSLVQMGLVLKKTGNALVSLIGGREVHPVNVRVGGFHGLPDRRGLSAMEEPLKRSLDLAMEAVQWAAKLPFPDCERDYECVSLQPGTGYPIYGGEIISSSGSRLEAHRYESAFTETQVAHSHALHSSFGSRDSYLVGPLARFNLNRSRLTPRARQASEEAGLKGPCHNPFQSIIIRCVEIVHACEAAIEIVQSYEPPPSPFAEVNPVAGTGHGCTEAPRGLLYHRYVFDQDGLVREAKIVPPTSQNLTAMEEDLSQLVAQNDRIDDARLTWLCEQAVRNYDPCISCATHLFDASHAFCMPPRN
jgi:coenzyme F420-reducing hydrogenase alpha subunit